MNLLPVGAETTIITEGSIATAFKGKRVRVISNTASNNGQYRVELLESVEYGGHTVPVGKHLYAQYEQLIHVLTNKEAKSLLRK